jgi:hypothetical protein
MTDREVVIETIKYAEILSDKLSSETKFTFDKKSQSA